MIFKTLITSMALAVSLQANAKGNALDVAILYGTTHQVLKLITQLENFNGCLLWGQKSNELPTKTPTPSSGLGVDADRNGLRNDYQGWNFARNNADLPLEVLERLRRYDRIELGADRNQQTLIQKSIEEEAIRKSCVTIWPVIDTVNLEEGYRYMIEHNPIQLIPKGGTLAQSNYSVYLPNQIRDRVQRRDLPPLGLGGQIVLY